MSRATRVGILFLMLAAVSGSAHAADSASSSHDTLLVEHPEIVVSATRTPRNELNIPGSAQVILGSELRKRGTRTLAEALQDVVGLDTGEGSDNGSVLPNVGMWGLKEFDALLFTLNGVPVGGPFNPSLSQIPVDDLERIEVVKGPQGSLYGVSAFAGMIQMFTPESGPGVLRAGGGSFSQAHGNFALGHDLGNDRSLRLAGGYSRSDGWQDRTERDDVHGGATLNLGLGKGRMSLDLMGSRSNQDWGSPLPFDAGELVPGFEIDRNYSVGDAVVEHQVFSGTSRLTWPLGAHHLENTLALTHDSQHFLRSFPGEIIGDTLVSEALDLKPKETSLYEDVRLIANLHGAGTHELVAGTALTWGETKGKGREFEFDQLMSEYPEIETSSEADDPGDAHDFEDRRTFFGVYLHDAWTPTWRLTLEGGGRFDAASEELETEVDLPSGPVAAKDDRSDTDFSGDVSALFRLLPDEGVESFQAANVYASVRRAFKPAAPNLAEAEEAEILEPEHTTSWEVGFKTRVAHQVSFDVSYFDMTFENMVVSILGTGGLPELTNAGEERFRGIEGDLRWNPTALPGTSFDVGYAHHDAKFVDFTFVTPDGEFRDVSGKKLELVPREIVNARASLHLTSGPGGFVAVRYQGERPFNRRNTFFAEAYTEVDAGVSYDHDRWGVVVTGRNLGDDRHVVTESEIGDSQFYVAPPRRFSAELAYHF